MLIPRFSVRILLIVTTVCALFFYLVTLAIQGAFWAIALSTAISALVATFLLHAAIFAFAWLLASMRVSVRGRDASGSPFATAAPPQQIIPPPPPPD